MAILESFVVCTTLYSAVSLLQEVPLTTRLSYRVLTSFTLAVSGDVYVLFLLKTPPLKMLCFKRHLKDNGVCLKHPVYLNGLWFFMTLISPDKELSLQ